MQPFRGARPHLPEPALRPNPAPNGPVRPADLRQPAPAVPSRPPSPPSEFLNDQFFHDLEHGPVAQFPAPPPSPPGAHQDGSWLRPDSPTFRNLRSNANLAGHLDFNVAPLSPAGRMPMTREQSVAAGLFRHNILAADPDCSKRMRGEFIQAFKPDGAGLVATHPILFNPGGSIQLPASAFTHETTQVIHSHPYEAHRQHSGPSDQDYIAAYIRSRGNTGALKGEMVFHPAQNKFYYYEPKVSGREGLPRFFELIEPHPWGTESPGRNI